MTSPSKVAVRPTRGGRFITNFTITKAIRCIDCHAPLKLVRTWVDVRVLDVKGGRHRCR